MNDDQDLKKITDSTAVPLVDETTQINDEVISEKVNTQNESQKDQDDSEGVKDQKDADGNEGAEGKKDTEDVEVTDDQEDHDENTEGEKTEDESENSDESDLDPSQPSKSSTPSDEPTKPTKPVEPSGPKAHWYVVHTYSGHEAKVAVTLKQRIDSQKIQDKILDILVPTQEKIEIKEGKKSTIKEKIFPGYILIRMVLDDISWLAVRTTPGVTSFVGNANKPTPLSEAEVETIKRFMSMEAPKFKTAFAINEAVKIIEGPFAEFLGSIAEIDEEKGKLKVMVSIFGRETPVELDFLQVNKL